MVGRQHDIHEGVYSSTNSLTVDKHYYLGYSTVDWGMIQSIPGYPLRTSPTLVSISTHADVISTLPVTSRTWLNARASVVRCKTLMGKLQLDEQWTRWHVASTFIMVMGKTGRALDRSILDYQIDKWEATASKSIEPVDGASHFPDPIRLGTLATLYAARLLYYDELWFTDHQMQAATDIYTYWKIAHRAGYIWEQHLAIQK